MAKATPKGARDRRILVLAPTGRDRQLAAEVLAAHGFVPHGCATQEDLRSEVARGAGLALIADEALSADACRELLDVLRAQPYWSDLPVIVLGRRGEEV